MIHWAIAAGLLYLLLLLTYKWGYRDGRRNVIRHGCGQAEWLTLNLGRGFPKTRR